MTNENEHIKLTRDVVATLIPAGTRVELPVDADAVITQSLGGTYTIQVEGYLFRIEGKDADALGKTPEKALEIDEGASDEEIEKVMWQQLATCYDPEIPINIVDLGLIYDCLLERSANGQRKAIVRMTLTAPGCGMGDILVEDIREKLSRIPGLNDVEVELTFDPPWTRDMMSEAAQLQAGFI